MMLLIGIYLLIGMAITFIGEHETIKNEGWDKRLNMLQRLTLFCTWPIFMAIALYRRLNRRDL